MTGMDSTTKLLNERLDFVGIGAAERQALAQAKPVISASLDVALDKFYAKARSAPETAKFFNSEDHIKSAKARQARHWDLIASGNFDAAYVKAVTTIGNTHARLGLEPRWYIGGYALILESIIGAVVDSHLKGMLYKSKAPQITRDISAVVKAALIDMDYAITVYLDALQIEREKAEAARREQGAQQEQALTALETSLQKLADGDLTAVIAQSLAPQFDGLKSNFNSAIEKLDEAFGSIINAADETTSNSGELVSATDDMARRTEQQAASLEETSAALEEITTISKESASRAQEAMRVVSVATGEAKKSGEIVEQAVAAMTAIEDSSRKITQIISVIDQISFQTNLLALNAGVEAARAGDAGKGFAVVAQEVRELAQKSAAAAKEIKELIDRSFQDVLLGVSLVNRTGDTLRTIGEQVVDINGHIDAIAGSAREQSIGIVEINTAVSSMDQMTQQNAAMVEQTNAATHSLMRTSTSLKELVDQFKVSAGRSTGNHAPVRSQRYG
ncbi:globin-coupled sensor protein [Pararhizobium antarcticum]|uniref:Chemotaxis protein n=1 Tax=Pararhizobium antarcticum TaxID=1798805 RepID=A0A657M003_9HYPH|nr:globin-coupled sensor protein [Pararhizobium antarcticum]OJF96582.1 chemotaxis protein [Rhizobium sp. 58]OJG01413.1 chemotaxis protein [Pararhizobium antarcticum]